MFAQLRYSLFAGSAAVAICLLSPIGSAGQRSDAPNMRLILTAGLAGIHHGERAYYSSPVFDLDPPGRPPASAWTIVESGRTAFTAGDTIFFPSRSMTLDEFGEVSARLEPVSDSGSLTLSVGTSAIAWGIRGKFSPTALSDPWLVKHMGMHSTHARWQKRMARGVAVIAIAIRGEPIWPSNRLIEELPVVVAKRRDDEVSALLMARSIADTKRTFGVVDRLLQTDPGVPTYFADLGNSLVSYGNASPQMAQSMATLLAKRNPIFLLPGSLDMLGGFLAPDVVKSLPYLIASSGTPFPFVRTVQIDETTVQFASVGEMKSQSQTFLPIDTEYWKERRAVAEVVNEAAKVGKSIVIGAAQTLLSGIEAASNPLFSLVVAPLDEESGVLVPLDEVHVERNGTNGLHPLAPLVRISPLDVTELSLWWEPDGTKLSRVTVRRHAVTHGSPRANDNALHAAHTRFKSEWTAPALPDRAELLDKNSDVWTKDDFNRLLGRILMRATRSEIAIVEKNEHASPVAGLVTIAVAQSMFKRPGGAIVAHLMGDALSALFSVIEGGHFGVAVEVVGGDLKRMLVDEREIVDEELYRVVFTKRTWEQARGVLDELEDVSLGPQSASIYLVDSVNGSGEESWANAQQEIKMIGALPKAAMKDGVVLAPPEGQVIHEVLKRRLALKDTGELLAQHRNENTRHSLILELHALDISGKLNLQNAEAKNMSNNLSVASEQLAQLPYVFTNIHFDGALRYLTSAVDSALSGKVKFRLTQEYPLNGAASSTPDDDAIEIALETRIPLERMVLFEDTEWRRLTPIARLSYETRLWPISFLTTVPESSWNGPIYNWLPRRQSVQGLLGGVLRLKGEQGKIRIGMLMSYDLNEKGFLNASGLGGEINGVGSWRWRMLRMSIEGNFRALAPLGIPGASRLSYYGDVEGRLDVSVIGNLGIGLICNGYLGALMSHPLGPVGTGVVVGLALSYHDYLKWLF